MYNSLKYKELDEYILVDVRSPGEFEKFTIPGSMNISIFNNDEQRQLELYILVRASAKQKLGIDYASKTARAL